jgi:carboxylesterase type B
MRYARPPTGNLRWRAPVPPALEEDIQKAKEVGCSPSSSSNLSSSWSVSHTPYLCI